MIISYNCKTGEIYGTSDGRLHSDREIDCKIRPANVPDEDVVNYVVPHKVKFRTEVKPIFENRIVDEKTLKVEPVKVGTKKVKVGDGFEYDVYFKDFMEAVEKNEVRLFDFRIFETEDGEMVFDLVPEKPKQDKPKEEVKKVDNDMAEKMKQLDKKAKSDVKEKPCIADLEIRIIELERIINKLTDRADIINNDVKKN